MRMRKGEQEHLDTMERLVGERRTRPTALLPLWDVAGFVLGAGTALLGKEAAMACTAAVEEVITEHYNDQIRELRGMPFEEEELKRVLIKHRDDEEEHRDTGIAHGAQHAPFYGALSAVIKAGCRAAIALSEKV